MRVIPRDISEKLSRTMQTKANNANPSSDIWISRPYTALVSDAFLERQKVFDTPVTDASIAVCHPRFKTDNTMIYIGYIQDGKAKVTSAITKTKMEEHVWLQHDFEENASHISIAFDGVMNMGTDTMIEFITERDPWVFWINEGALYAKKLSSDAEPITLAVSNCTDVSVICATDSASSSFNFGLVAFFILEGTIYYRQLIDGDWKDGVPIQNVPENIVKIAAFRTWDHRVGVQMQTSEGKVYELYTQYMGIGKRNTEHIEVSDVTAKGDLCQMKYHDGLFDERVEVADITSYGYFTWGLSSVPLSVENLDDGTGNYGFIVRIVLDHPVRNVTGTYERFSMVDSVGIKYLCTDAYAEEDGLAIVLTFMNFNVSAGNDLTVTYTPASPHILCPAANLAAFSYTFTPTGLVLPDVPIPEPVSAWAVNSVGTQVAIEFTQPLISSVVSGNEDKLSIAYKEYNFVPGGELIDATRPIVSVSTDAENGKILYLNFGSGNVNNLQNGVGDATITYAGGTLYGEGGPIADFEITFTFDGLTSKNHPNTDNGHIEIGDITAVGVLKLMVYTDTKDGDEKISIADITATGTLTHIDDL